MGKDQAPNVTGEFSTLEIICSFYRKEMMPNSDLLPSLLFKINENQLALEAAIMELTNWVEQRGSAEVAENVRGALWAIDRNEEFIKMTLALMMTPD